MAFVENFTSYSLAKTIVFIRNYKLSWSKKSTNYWQIQYLFFIPKFGQSL